jgi:hypothetical protein
MADENNTNQVTTNAPASHPYALPQYAQAPAQPQPQISISDIMSEMHKMKTENETLSKKLSELKDAEIRVNSALESQKKAEALAASHGEFVKANLAKRIASISEAERKLAGLDPALFDADPLSGPRQVDLFEAMKAALAEQEKAKVAEDVTQTGAQPQTGVKPPSNFAEANALYLRMIKGKQ